MELLSVSPFEFEGEHYEIRLTSEDMTVTATAFKDGQPANGYTHSVTSLIKRGISKKRIPVDIFQDLINAAIDDVKSKTWERYLKALDDLDGGPTGSE